MLLFSRNMEARRESLQVPKVQLKQKFGVTEDSIAKLLMVGAKIVEAVTQTDRYYDTASDDLAMAGLWLSRRDQEWFLIVESQKKETQGNLEEQSQGKVANPEPLCQEMTSLVHQDPPHVCRKSSKPNPVELGSLPNHQDQQLDGKTADSESDGPNVSSAFTELVGKGEIMAYLEAHLRLDLQTEEREEATMEIFLEKAGIEHYASNHLIKQTTYLLSDRYTIIVQREESGLRESVTVSLEVDVFNICGGLEEIEKLAAYLGFEHPGSQSEREFMT
ncbi:uncharacterized protein LOC107293697 isoform X1 [Protobothrops mucrosquamatus]|uniref:uncharacterized protein LOC107293697 isoform X1 n=2 Tax=Protobothrops mucrosquamatus TaxID=103944 RepID=UPI0007758A30|nr:uncharacterized protein LOC107293697 isoform X1 [Protobothrops mucrosquamatus]